MVVRLHYYSDKEKILGLSKSKGRLTYRGGLGEVFPDVIYESRGRQVAGSFQPGEGEAPRHQDEYSLYYPAKLTLTRNGIGYSFDTPKAAEEFYDKKIAPTDQRDG